MQHDFHGSLTAEDFIQHKDILKCKWLLSQPLLEVISPLLEVEDGIGFEPMTVRFCKPFLWTAQAPVLYEETCDNGRVKGKSQWEVP